MKKASFRKRVPGMLEKVLGFAFSEVAAIDSGSCTLDETLDRAPEESRRTLEHLLTTVFRYRKSLRASWSKFCRKQPSVKISALLDCALAQCRYQDAVTDHSVVNVAVFLAKKEHADKFVNAVLRAVLREEYKDPCKASEILPDAVISRWNRDFSEEQTERFACLFLSKPEFTFRICRGADIPAESIEIPAHGSFRFASAEPSVILNRAEFAGGKYYIQDPAASMAVSLTEDIIKDCRKVADICSAPGGKALMISEILAAEAELTASDISSYRQKLTVENFRKRGIAANIVTCRPEELPGGYDLVVADVPCSNTGVFRRRPDALWRFSAGSLKEIMTLQRKIISSAFELVSPGGYLLISTCSIEADENRALLEAFPGSCRILKSKTLLPSESSDGAFAALVQKSSAE